MATFTTNTSNGFYMILTVTQSSQSVTNNTSTLSWSLKYYCGSKYYQNSSTTDAFRVTIDGTTVYNTSRAISFSGSNSSITISSGTTTVSHNTDGTKSVSVSCSCTPGRTTSTASYYPAGTMSASGTMTLTTIARASSISSVSGSTIGSAVTISISRQSTSFTHTLTYKFGSTSGTIGTGLTTSASWTPALTLCQQIPNATSGTGTLTLTTYSGSTSIGTATKSFTLSVPSSAVPSISSRTLSEAVSGINSQFGGYVQNKSRLSVSISASGYQGSSISSYSTTVGGTTYSGSSFTSGYLTSSGSVTVATTVKDSRGKSASLSSSITVLAYSNPTATTFTVQRCNSDGTVSNEGAYVKATYSFSIATVNNRNTHSAKIQYLNGSTWTDLYTDSTNYSVTNATYVSTRTFSEDEGHDFRLYVADYFTSTSSTAHVDTAFTLINYNAEGNGLAFGKVNEIEDYFESNLATRFYDFNYFDLGYNSHNANASGGTSGYLKVATLYINGTYANSPIEFKVSRRTAMLWGIITIRFENLNGTDPDVSFFTVRDLNIPTYLVKSATSTWDLYIEKAESYENLAIQLTYNCSYMGNRVLITWQDEVATSLPSDYIEATKLGYYSTDGNFYLRNRNFYALGFVINENDYSFMGTATSGTQYSIIKINGNDHVVVNYGGCGHTYIGSNSTNGRVVAYRYGSTGVGFFDLGYTYQSGSSCAVRAYMAADESLHEILTRNADATAVALGYSSAITVLRGTSVRLSSTTGTTVTSDANLKKDFAEFDERYDEFYDNLNPQLYKYILGTSGRAHCGFITQEVEEALENANITTQEFGGVVIIENLEREQEEDEDGNVNDIPNSTHNYLLDNEIDEMHNLIYQEFIALNTWQIQKLKTRVAEQDNIIQELSEQVNSQNETIEELKEQVQELIALLKEE